jgi:hypothetical protein
VLRTPAITAITLLVVALSAIVSPSFAASKTAATSIAFSIPVQADPQRFATEPSLLVDPQGQVWTSGPWGFSTGQSFLWRSQNTGDTYDLEKLDVSPVGLRPCSTPVGPGGGDTDQIAFTAVNGQHVVMFADLEAVASVLICTSFDGGNSWAVQNVLATAQQAEGLADRMWLAHDVVDGTDVEYMVNDDSVSGGDAVYRTIDYGANWEVVAQPAFATATAIGNPGGITVDQVTHTIFLSNTDALADGTPVVVVGVGRSALSGPIAFTERVVARLAAAPYPADLARVALDTAGGVYVTWAEPADDSTKMASSMDHGTTWSQPATASLRGTKTFFGAIAAGSPGRADLAFYSTTNQAPLASNSGPWFVSFAQTLNAASSSPQFAVTVVTPHPVHVNPVCLQGLNCTAVQPADRNLGDFMSIAVDASGAALIAYDDTANQLFDPAFTSSAGAPDVHVVRQVAGSSAFTGIGQLSGAASPVGSVTDRTGDATWPKQGAVGPNIDRLDLTSAALVTDLSGVHARLGVKSTAGLGLTTAGGESWMLQWWSNAHLYYVKADATPSGLVCYGGEPAAVTNTSGNGKAAIYFGGTPTTCATDATANTITIDVPSGAVGMPATGTPLYEVTAYAFLWDLPGALMNQVDATAPFGFTVGK